ncbi:MAG: hypothetical protein RR150_12020, partial [Clostridia bacterium]
MWDADTAARRKRVGLAQFQADVLLDERSPSLVRLPMGQPIRSGGFIRPIPRRAARGTPVLTNFWRCNSMTKKWLSLVLVLTLIASLF